MRPRVALTFALLSGMMVATAAAAADPTKEQCIAANDQQQALRAQRKFRAAREAARACANPACPALVRTDCAQAVYDIDHQIPTMVFETKDADGHDLAAVKVTMDGQLLADHLDGSALDVDVGEHDFVFESAGATVRQHFLVREGDRARHERIDFPAAPKPKPVDPPVVVAPPPAADTPRNGTGQRVAGAVVGGLGIVGIVVGAVFVAKGNAGNADLKNPEPSICPVGQGTTCQNAIDLKSEVQTQWTGGAIALALGGAALIAGVIVFLTAPSGSAARTSLVVAPSFGPNGASLALSGRF